MARRTRESLRSWRWYGKDDLRSFGHRSRTKQMGWLSEDYEGKPIVAIVNPWNEFVTCHTHFPERVEDIKRGVRNGGGTPVEIPVLGLGEQLMKPSAMLYRNFLALEVEEALRAYPVDGVVLLAGCDKTTPALLMGACAVNIPCVYVPAGAMLRGTFRGETLASGTDVWRYWDERRAGKFSTRDWKALEEGIARSAGTCMSMGTAASMMLVTEALGLSLAGASTIPAVDSSHRRMAAASGALAVEAIWEDRKPSDILKRASFDNAMSVLMAIGGSTNAIIHLLALARRCGVALELRDFHEASKRTPVLANLKPVGEYVMEDFHEAGGSTALMRSMGDLLDRSAATVSGKTLGETLGENWENTNEVYNDKVICSRSEPLHQSGGLAVLFGSLAPRGAVIKAAAAERRLWKHEGRAVVFDSMMELRARIDDPALEVDEDSVLVLRNAGPCGAPGMPEWGQLPLPKKLVERGVRDMLRISDARMSGTSYGACVLHVAPEAALGGPLGLVEGGDVIRLDVEEGRLDWCVEEGEAARRRERFRARAVELQSGYARLYVDRVLQADEGCDFDFAQRGFAKTLEEYPIF